MKKPLKERVKEGIKNCSKGNCDDCIYSKYVYDRCYSVFLNETKIYIELLENCLNEKTK